MTERGVTYSERWRHECEVRHVVSLPTREERAAYLDALPKHRAAAAVQRLREDVRAAWIARHARQQSPAPLRMEAALRIDHAAREVNSAVNV